MRIAWCVLAFGANIMAGVNLAFLLPNPGYAAHWGKAVGFICLAIFFLSIARSKEPPTHD